MGVFKEEAHIIEAIAKNQKQIFNDACDYGYPYKESNPPSEVTNLINTIDSLKSLDKEFPGGKKLVRNRMTWRNGVSLDVIIFWEKDEGFYCGTKYHITFNRINPRYSSLIQKGNDAYISVDIKRVKER